MNKPKEGKRYWYIAIPMTGTTKVNFYQTNWYNYIVDIERFDEGNCFRTKKLAQTAYKKIKKILKESDGGWDE